MDAVLKRERYEKNEWFNEENCTDKQYVKVPKMLD